MERGPTALFGAIVAVGLGPALWLGAQVGAADASTIRPPAVISEHDSGSDKQLLGGTGGSVDTSDDGTTVIHATPRANVRPLNPEPSARPSSASSDPEPSESTSPTPSGSVDPSPSDEPSGEPSQPSSEPSDDPPSNGGSGDETDDPTTPPAPPPSNDDGGSGGNGGGDDGGSDEGDSGGDKGDTGPTVPTGENTQVSAH